MVLKWGSSGALLMRTLERTERWGGEGASSHGAAHAAGGGCARGGVARRRRVVVC